MEKFRLSGLFKLKVENWKLKIEKDPTNREFIFFMNKTMAYIRKKYYLCNI